MHIQRAYDILYGIPIESTLRIKPFKILIHFVWQFSNSAMQKKVQAQKWYFKRAGASSTDSTT